MFAEWYLYFFAKALLFGNYKRSQHSFVLHEVSDVLAMI